MDPDMSIPVPCVLYGLGVKCVLNWALILFQREHVWSSFVCVFGLSLAAVDSALTLAVTLVHLRGDADVLGLRVTRYHVCLLVQVLGHVYSAQHLSVLAITALEHSYTVLRRLRCDLWTPTWIFQLFLTALVWFFSVLFVFKLANVQPYLEDVAYFQIHHCWTSSSNVISELAVVISCLCLCWIVFFSLKCLVQIVKNPCSNPLLTVKIQIRLKLMFMTKVARIFCGTWAPFLAFPLLQAALPMPSHLGLNCAWLCFLNSVLAAAALCAGSSASELARSRGSAALPPDSFCDWTAEFSSERNSTARERRL